MNKKLLFIFVSILFLLGCENIINTPTSKVESFYKKYQMLDKNVLIDLDNVIDKDKTLNKKQKNIYKEVLKRQYQNLSYKIKSEEVEKTTAIVETEIEVLDYKNNNDNIDEKLKIIKKANKRKKYNITFYLTKKAGVWKIDNLQNEDYEKINGMY